VIPIRAALAIMATVVALVMLLSFKTPDTASVRVSRPPLSSPAVGPTTSAPSPSAAPVTPGSTSPTANGSGLRDGQYTGQDVSNRYGDVQVRVTVSGGRVADVQPLTMPSDRQRSADITQYSAPLLHDEVVQAQSAHIDTISGATYTSDSYARSVQSALDQAHG